MMDARSRHADIPLTVLTRREFLRVTAIAGAGLVLAVYLPGCRRGPTAIPEPTATGTSSPRATATPEPTATGTSPPPTRIPAGQAGTSTPRATTTPEPTATGTSTPHATVTPEPTATETSPPPTPSPTPVAEVAPNLFVRVDSNGIVTITVARSEMGQGVRTALAMIIADELDADWSTVRIEQAPGDRAYGDQTTGGSVSISNHYTPLRQAGATARYMLVSAAAQEWGVAPESCTTEKGWVIDPEGVRRLSYGELAVAAATLSVPYSSGVPLKDPQDFHLIGKPMGHWDAPQIVTGRAVYGSDVRLPGCCTLQLRAARCSAAGSPALTRHRPGPCPACAM